MIAINWNTKNDNKSSISLLTTTGVVTVKFTREYYAMFKKQISQIQPDGTKKVVEPGWFKRGTLLVITGYRRDDMFVAKTYAKTETHQLYKIDQVIGDEIVLRHERFSQNGTRKIPTPEQTGWKTDEQIIDGKKKLIQELIDRYVDEMPEEIANLMKKYRKINFTKSMYMDYLENKNKNGEANTPLEKMES